MTRWLLAVLLLAVPDVALARPNHRAAPMVATVAPLPAPEQVMLAASGGRSVDVSVLSARRARGVVLFGHGYGGQPIAYARLIERLWRAGYSVVAPLSLDSFAGPLKGQVEPQRAFATRIEDMRLVRGYIARRFARQPVVLAGHSFGSLMALIGAGAKTPAG